MTEIVKYKLLFKEYEASVALYERIDNLSEIQTNFGHDFNICLINALLVCIHFYSIF